MGILENAKETVAAATKKVGDVVEEGIDKLKDKADEVQADVNVKKAEAERDAVQARNAAKDKLRD